MQDLDNKDQSGRRVDATGPSNINHEANNLAVFEHEWAELLGFFLGLGKEHAVAGGGEAETVENVGLLCVFDNR